MCGLVVALGFLLAAGVAKTDLVTDWDTAILDSARGARGPLVDGIAKAAWALTLSLIVYALRVASVIVMAITKRWRHMVVFLGALVVTDWLAVRLLDVALGSSVTARAADAPRYPMMAVASLSITVFAMAFTLVPGGKQRSKARGAATVLMAVVVLAGTLLAEGRPLPMAYAALMAGTIAFVAFKSLAPEDSFPVSYERGGSTAHLDLSGARAEAVKKAVADQLGLAVSAVKAFGLEGSGGSSPLRMTLEDGSHLFGKIYATSHVRADRWYKIGRTIMYGQLEDEVPFGSVLRIVEYEDYALRLLEDSGIPVAKTYGVVELTPQREYMLATEMFEGAKNLGDSEIDVVVIDEGMRLVRALWDAGIAHRDIKPANLLVVDGHLQVVDVSNIELRPTPWREAVDLANMMLTLALQSDADLVYARATEVFAPEEIAEAFAAARGMAIPTQLQTRLKADPRPLMQRFKELAPARDPIPIQRWSLRRIAVAAAAAMVAVVLVSLFFDSLRVGL